MPESFKCITSNTEVMTDVIVSFRVDKKLHERMKKHSEINWSAVLRRAVENNTREFDKERVRRAFKEIDELRKSGAFSNGKNSTEIIREWRDKR